LGLQTEEANMKSVIPVVAIAILLSATTPAPAADPPSALGTPRSVQLQHEQIVGRLESVAKRGGPAGVAAAKAATFLKAHYARPARSRAYAPAHDRVAATLSPGGAVSVRIRLSLAALGRLMPAPQCVQRPAPVRAVLFDIVNPRPWP
jgi:hypothetical protein